MAKPNKDVPRAFAPKSLWIRRWADGKATWHLNEHDKFLDKENSSLLEGRAKSVFVPLCEKSPNILWMYNHDYTVVGVDIAEQAVKEFFTDNNIDFDVVNIEGVGCMYKSKDNRIKLYVADVFDMSRDLCGMFDIIYDSRAVIVINVTDYTRYRDLMKSLMKPDGHYYVFTCDYDHTVYPGPPHPMSPAEFERLFGGSFNIELVEEFNFFDIMGTFSGEYLADPSTVAMMKSKFIYNRRHKLTLKH